MLCLCQRSLERFFEAEDVLAGGGQLLVEDFQLALVVLRLFDVVKILVYLVQLVPHRLILTI